MSRPSKTRKDQKKQKHSSKSEPGEPQIYKYPCKKVTDAPQTSCCSSPGCNNCAHAFAEGSKINTVLQFWGLSISGPKAPNIIIDLGNLLSDSCRIPDNSLQEEPRLKTHGTPACAKSLSAHRQSTSQSLFRMSGDLRKLSHSPLSLEHNGCQEKTGRPTQMDWGIQFISSELQTLR